MPGASIRFDAHELDALTRTLDAGGARARDLTPLMDAIGMAMETTTHERFEAEEDARGKPWKPSIRARTEGGQTLRDKGHLDNSITHVPSSDAVEIGSGLIYAAPNFFGATITAKPGGYLKFGLPGGLGFRSVGSVTLPSRNPLGVGGDDEENIVELAEDFLAGGLAA